MTKNHPIADLILDWYPRNRRDLPWRQTRDPYSIWVSEIMLQQTRVDTAVPYYLRFVKRFPTVEALARADLQEVLKAWENLGYYSRARHFHEAAKIVLEEFQGNIPKSLDSLTSLPGIGLYTASAILCFAFGARLPTVDANVRRVTARLFAIQRLLDRPAIRRDIHRLAAGLVPRENPGEYNQGLMELGAQVCTARSPSCTDCPLQEFCRAFMEGCQHEIPRLSRPRSIPHRIMASGLVFDASGRMLIAKRPDYGLLGGLWKFPGGFLLEKEPPEAGLKRTILKETGVEIVNFEALDSVRHAYSHFRLTACVYHCILEKGEARPRDCSTVLWVHPESLLEMPLSSVDRKIFDLFLQARLGIPTAEENAPKGGVK